MDLNKVKKLSNLLLVGVVAAFLAATVFREDQLVARISIGVMILLTLIYTVLRIRYWRCPYCKRLLGPEKDLTDCPYCGEKLPLQ